ncbi:hypothetical protein CYLTODRAFT_415846 [Cylindrobasidium torrendii FP15055 ss-10]|uniref:Uncharacterized protein n=1 Tax=Cylindrobasidium torrendii FP15055 ss-10 TaxID=1314674 RepID=A0A0D7AS72_9AGAR|nr:hypothetical protein CYLTODRAFT_415846 [Cylindrobasidium torrendii FP15055 ss-10]
MAPQVHSGKQKLNEPATSTPGPSQHPGNTVAGHRMQGTLLNKGKDLLDRDPAPAARCSTKPLPGRKASASNIQTGPSKKSACNEADVSSGDKQGDETPTKRRCTSQPIDKGEVIDLTAKAPVRHKKNDAKVLEYVKVDEKTRLAHSFKRLACKACVCRFQDTGDLNSNSGLRKHAVKCYTKEVVEDAHERDVHPTALRNKILEQPKGKLRSMKISLMFNNQCKAGVTSYSTIPHTPTQTRAECVRWCAEDGRPFCVVRNRGFLSMMKTRRPHHWVPHPTTVAQDTKKVFAKTRQRIAKMMQTSANHRASVAITAHLLVAGKPKSLLLDFFEVPESHTGETFAREIGRKPGKQGSLGRMK